jgi:hypothetical protein
MAVATFPSFKTHAFSIFTSFTHALPRISTCPSIIEHYNEWAHGLAVSFIPLEIVLTVLHIRRAWVGLGTPVLDVFVNPSPLIGLQVEFARGSTWVELGLLIVLVPLAGVDVHCLNWLLPISYIAKVLLLYGQGGVLVDACQNRTAYFSCVCNLMKHKKR